MYEEFRSYTVIFLNKLEVSHILDFDNKPGSGSLELDYRTISTDPVLEKLQIPEINRKDLIDVKRDVKSVVDDFLKEGRITATQTQTVMEKV
jgi:hypothetical protein